MPDLHVMTRAGGQTTIKQGLVDELSRTMGGQVLTPSSAEYDKARAVWNAMFDRRPALIVRCAETQDVVEAIRFARRHDLLVAVRGGGHNIAGTGVCDGGIVIDLSLMSTIQVDPTHRTVRVGSGAILADVDRATQAHGLVTPLGINSTTGIAGLTLGGGFGWISRRYGLTIDNLNSVEIVLASGETLRASATEHADLFWGVRGGGGNFGVVTSFEFRLHEMGPEILSGLIIHPLDAARDALRFYRDFIADTPEEFVCWAVLRQAPPLPFLAPEWHGREVLILAVCHCGRVPDGERVAAPLRGYGRPLADVIAPTPFTEWQRALDPLLGAGARNYWKSHNIAKLSDGLIDVLVDFARRIPDPQSDIGVLQVGGAVNRVPTHATAYAARDAQFILNVHGRWSDPSKDVECMEWARALLRAAEAFATGGAYVNFLTHDDQDRVRASYGANYDRLVELKTRFDPMNHFRLNVNIRPKR